MRDDRAQSLGSTTSWVSGLIVSILFIWGVSYFFWNNRPPLERDVQLNTFVRTPGVVQWRSEGWADTYYGKHGLLLEEEKVALSDAPKLVLWGDSHIEAWQIPDEQKISSVFNKSSSSLKCVTFGQSGWSVADYILTIPAMERVLPNTRGHAILLSGMQDTLPTRGGSQPYSATFTDTPSLQLREADKEGFDSPTHLKHFVHQWSLRFVTDSLMRVRNHKWRFTLGPTPKQAIASSATQLPIDYQKAWSFLLTQLKNVSSGELIVVYCPLTPYPEEGNVNFVDSEKELKDAFSDICKKNNIGFVDMSDSFNQLYARSNQLPRGFFNTPQGFGHLNARGQKLIAQELKKYTDSEVP